MMFWVTLTENGFCEVCTKWASVTNLSERTFKKTQKKNSHFSLFFSLRSYSTIELSDPEVIGHRHKKEENSTAKCYHTRQFFMTVRNTLVCTLVIIFQLSWNHEKNKLKWRKAYKNLILINFYEKSSVLSAIIATK